MDFFESQRDQLVDLDAQIGPFLDLISAATGCVARLLCAIHISVRLQVGRLVPGQPRRLIGVP